jgi:hypothetical protein
VCARERESAREREREREGECERDILHVSDFCTRLTEIVAISYFFNSFLYFLFYDLILAMTMRQFLEKIVPNSMQNNWSTITSHFDSLMFHLPNTHTHTHTHTHTNTYKHIHTQTHTLTHKHSHAHTHTHTFAAFHFV